MDAERNSLLFKILSFTRAPATIARLHEYWLSTLYFNTARRIESCESRALGWDEEGRMWAAHGTYNNGREMRVLITGGAGYIGQALTHRLLKEQAIEEIIVYDNFLRANYTAVKIFKNETRVKMIRGDMLDLSSLKKALNKVDIVLHLAGVVRAPFNEEFSHMFEQTNHWGTATLCSALEEIGHIKKIINLSSAAVYGYASHAHNVLDNPLPVSSYGNSKLAGERQLKRIASSVQTITLRLGSVFGTSDTMHYGSLINQFNLNLALKEPLVIHGTGEQIRPYVSLFRVIEMIRHVVFEQGEGNHTYNMYDFNLSCNDVLSMYKALSIDFDTIYVSQNQVLNSLKLAGMESVVNCIGPSMSALESVKRSLYI